MIDKVDTYRARPRWRDRLTAIGVVLMLCLSSGAAHANKWGRDYIPNLPVVTQTGQTLRFYDDVIAGKRLVISFIFTSCREMCPLITARLKQVYDALGPAAGRDVQFVSISVDPVNDTPARMKEHADAFQVGPGWLFLTGTADHIKQIRHKLGDRSTNLLDHRQDIWLVNDATGDWQRDSAFNDAAVVVHNIESMVARVEPQARASEARPRRSKSIELPGQGLYDRACAACHLIGGGSKVGPDLVGVSRRRDAAWLVGFIRNPERYHAAGDAVAMTLAASYKGVRMPSLGLSERDAADLIAYIEARTFAAEMPTPAGHAHHGHGTPAATKRSNKSGHAHH